MYLYFLVLDSCLIFIEITEPEILVSGEISILCIILEIDALFETGQVLDVHKVLRGGVCIYHVGQI